MSGGRSPGAIGFGWRSGVLAWVGLTTVVVLLAAVAWLPSSVGSSGVVVGPYVAVVGGLWLGAFAQIVIGPVAAVAGVGAGLWLRRRRRGSRVGGRPARGGSR